MKRNLSFFAVILLSFQLLVLPAENVLAETESTNSSSIVSSEQGSTGFSQPSESTTTPSEMMSSTESTDTSTTESSNLENEIPTESTESTTTTSTPEEPVKEVKAQSEEIKTPNIKYQTHIQDIGWQGEKSNGEISGTSGQAKRIEGIKIKVADTDSNGGIEYKTHVEDYGWQNFVANGEMSGTSGQAKRLEAIQMKLTGEFASKYDIYYRVHVEDFGWLDWASNGKDAGTCGFALRLEAIQISLVKKGEKAPGPTTLPSIDNNALAISYQSHIQDIGWQAAKKNGELSGTSGQAKRLEGLKVKIETSTISGGVQYKTHVEDYGWQNYVANGALSGTTGKGKRLEALQVRLTGDLSRYFDVYYRGHVEDFGWLGWTKNDGVSGSSGYGFRLEAIEMRLVKKGAPAPGLSSSYKKAPADIQNYYMQAPGRVMFKTSANYYNNADLTSVGNPISAGTVLNVQGRVMTKNGYPVLKTAYGYITANKRTVGATAAGEKTLMNVPYYNQNQMGYWNGCEEFSLYMALSYLGATRGQNIHQVTNAVPRVPAWGNPADGFNGNPTDTSGYHTIFPRAFTPYAKRYAPNSRDISGSSTAAFKTELLKGNPVVVWGTSGPIAAPRIGGYYYGALKVLNLHVWLVTGFDGNSFHVTDPVYGKFWVSEGQVATSYSPNRMAVAIDK
ncbi:MAG: C39 family peptidase [Lactobacillales bacterium]|jgi:uncharacterized protein YjdB/uncharacterized protein YvpB|nr:C39 family peptidase [Lactobacillales bacterium]